MLKESKEVSVYDKKKLKKHRTTRQYEVLTLQQKIPNKPICKVLYSNNSELTLRSQDCSSVLLEKKKKITIYTVLKYV